MLLLLLRLLMLRLLLLVRAACCRHLLRPRLLRLLPLLCSPWLLLCLLRLPVWQVWKQVVRLGIRNHHAPLLGISVGHSRGQRAAPSSTNALPHIREDPTAPACIRAVCPLLAWHCCTRLRNVCAANH